MGFFKTQQFDPELKYGSVEARPSHVFIVNRVTTERTMMIDRKLQKNEVRRKKIEDKKDRGKLTEEEALAESDRIYDELIDMVKEVTSKVMRFEYDESGVVIGDNTEEIEMSKEFLEKFEADGNVFFGPLWEALTMQSRGQDWESGDKKKSKVK